MCARQSSVRHVVAGIMFRRVKGLRLRGRRMFFVMVSPYGFSCLGT